MTPDEVKEAAEYVLDNQDDIIAVMFENELADRLLHAYMKHDADPSDEKAQRDLVEALAAYKEAQRHDPQ